jgi:hypothetical protein
VSGCTGRRTSRQSSRLSRQIRMRSRTNTGTRINDGAIGSSPFPWRKQETGAAGPTPNPASTNHLAPQYTVSDAKVGNPTNALRISKTARKRGRRLWLAVAGRSLRREDQGLLAF